MNEQKKHLSLGRNIKIGFFHLGSGMADVLTTGVWNRIMISDLGFAATPVGLLVSLRYFLAPLGIWAGRMSDQRTIFGVRRLFWIWLGRLLMVLSTFGLGFATAQLARDTSAPTAGMWVVLAFALLLFSLGNALSGTTFLALIYDRASEEQRGRAVGIVWTFLLLGFTVGGIIFGILLPESEGSEGLQFAPDALQNLFIIAGLIFSTLWFFSLLGEERRRDADPIKAEEAPPQSSMMSDLSLVWRNRSLRFFFLYLVLSMFFAFSQDLVLEPFAGDVFDMSASTTNRFAAYWGGTAIVGTIFFLWLSRRVPRLTNTVMSQMGVAFLTLTFALFTLSAVAEIRELVRPGLILLGVGLGIWNVGTLGLMMDMSPVGRAGTFLGFWTLSVTFARGGGVAGGGIVRDIWLQITGSPALSYAVVFGAGAVGLIVAGWCLTRVNAPSFKREVSSTPQRSSSDETATIFAGAME